MDGDKHGKVYLDCATSREPSNVCSISREIRLQNENVILKEEIDDIHYVYLFVTRYLLLKTLSLSSISPNITFIKEMKPNEFLGVCKMMDGFSWSLFDEEYGEITDAWVGETNALFDIDCVEKIVSRCLMLCDGESTSIHFVLVAGFLSYLISIDYRDMDCFQMLYISEFCLEILYRRIFWKVFKSKEGYDNLRSFCDEFNERSYNATVRELLNTNIGIRCMKLLRDCIDATEDRFWLDESELELFRNSYSVAAHMEYTSAVSSEIESQYFRYCVIVISKRPYCCECGSRCYSYLEHACMFI